jgi:hypothetical protein
MNGATDYQTFTLAVYPTPDDTCSVFLPLPTEAAVLTLDKYGSAAMLLWDPVPDASGYDALQGDLGALHLSYGDIRASVESCLAEDVNTNSIVHSSDPASRRAYWFLVRGRNCQGSGTLDSYDPYGVQIAPRLSPPFEIECP